MIEARLLEHAVTLADQGSFALAAQALGLSQPALSRSIQSLETQLGVQLFERGRRRIEPTDAGQIFLDQAREILAKNAALVTEMGLAQQQRASFTLAVGPYVADTIAATVLAQMSARRPEVQFRLQVTSWVEAVKRVRAREAELCIADASQLGDDPDLHCEALPKMQGYLGVRVGHPLLSKPALDGAQVFAYPLVTTGRLPPRILGPLQQGRSPAAGSQTSAFPAIICEQISVMKSVVMQSDAVGFFVLPLVESELRSGTLALLDYHVPWLHTQFGIISLRGRASSEVAQDVVALARSTAQDLERCEQRLALEFSASPRHKVKKSG